MNADTPTPTDAPRDPLLARRLTDERALLGCALMAQAETRQTCGWLTPEAFWLEDGQAFWRKFAAGDDAYEVALELGLLDKVALWSNEVVSATYAGEYARRVAEGAYMQQSKRLALQLAQACSRGEHEAARALQEQLTSLQPRAHQGARNWFEAAVSFIELLDADLRSIPTGVPPLDRAIAGFERQTESVIAARPSQGKSTLALQMALHAAGQGLRVLFMSLEMSEANLFARAACPLVGVTWLDVRKGLVTGRELERLKTAAAELGAQYQPNLFVYDRRATTETVWELAQTHGADLVFVDHIRKLGDAPEQKEVKRLGYITNRLKDMAKALNLHACVLVQLNRGADADDNRAPELKHLRDSGEIEEDADLVLMLHGLPVKDSDRAKPVRDTDLWIRKARDGVKDAKVELRFHLRDQRFTGRANYAADE